MIYKPKHLTINEVVPDYLLYIHEVALWKMFDPALLISADCIRDRYGPIIVNGNYKGTKYNHSGLRTRVSTHYRENSMHSIGMGLDIKFLTATAEEVRADLKLHGNFALISRIEKDTPTWLHIDTKPTNKNKIHFFKP